MSILLTFHPGADQDLDDAATYYGRERFALAHTFVTEIERCIVSIGENPDAGMRVLGDVRRRLVRRFSYGVLYAVHGREILVVAIAHLKRRPFY